MGKYQVTQTEFQAVMEKNPSYFKGSNFPVEKVTWFEAVEFCNRLSQLEGLTLVYTINGKDVSCNWSANGYRLPTEAEWEYACRAGTTTPYNTGNNITTSQANYNGYYSRPISVGSYAPNPWGLYDMHGNVDEWCWDWYGSYSSGAQTNPRGPASGTYHVVRGGNWYNYSPGLRSAYRGLFSPSVQEESIGFRVVRN
jgi:formylglycine-generating enzyme required for sulfatase activity